MLDRTPLRPRTHTHAEHTCSNNSSANLVGIYLRIHSMSFLTNHCTWQQLAWTILYPLRKLHSPSDISPSPSAPPRMFIAQKIISQVISAPLWTAINFSSLHDGPACGHRSLTFSKRSINLSVHPATYPLMFSSCTVVFFFFLLPLSLAANCLVVSGFKLMCSSAPGGCLFVQLFRRLRARPESASEENDGHFEWEEYALETKGREDHLEGVDGAEPCEGTGSCYG